MDKNAKVEIKRLAELKAKVQSLMKRLEDQLGHISDQHRQQERTGNWTH